ncbi:unnamed protein product [Hydatigera taeniaeformis]|uniref:Uncharacterized protein n=1 Tax=Hydatigena taeniaeformis TaxID=6205 RepID=A0A0R3WMP6_HYDTA|nr:unnamed protein product [Hydatigera taeniaeformis]
MARQTLESVKSVFELKERIQKEENAAYKFFVENKDSLCSPENLGTASKIIRHQLELSGLKNEHCVAMLKAAEEKRKREELEHKMKLRELELKSFNADDLPSLELMRPVTPEIRDTLYEGISATGGGRFVPIAFHCHALVISKGTLRSRKLNFYSF